MKKLMILLWVVVGLVLVAAVATYLWLPGFVDKKIQEKIAQLRADGVEISYDTIRAEVWSNRVTVDSLTIRIPEQSFTASINQAQLRRFKIFAFLFRREIHFGKLVVDRPALTLPKKWKVDSTREGQRAKPVTLFLDSVRFNRLTVVRADSLDTLKAGLDLRIMNLAYNNALPEPFDFSIISIWNAGVQLEMYDLVADRIYLDRTLKQLEVDSLSITPRFSKAAFAARSRVENDRFEGVIPSVRARDFEVGTGDSVYIAATEFALRFNLSVYRNKHYPFPDRNYMPLPMAALKDLPFALKIDTVKLGSSFVSYEEVGENADSSGTVFFEDLRAVIHSLSSDSAAPAPALHAEAKFMGKGKLEVHCEFSRTQKPSVLRGSLEEFPLVLLNDVLKPQAGIAIERGTVSLLSFRFTFNDIQSQGTTDLSYRNLKVIGLKEKKQTDQVVKRELLTLALNMFIKDDAGRYETGERMTGEIAFERDRRKAIFNYWWKSLFSGIKSSFNLPNGQARNEKNGRDKNKRGKKVAA